MSSPLGDEIDRLKARVAEQEAALAEVKKHIKHGEDCGIRRPNEDCTCGYHFLVSLIDKALEKEEA